MKASQRLARAAGYGLDMVLVTLLGAFVAGVDLFAIDGIGRRHTVQVRRYRDATEFLSAAATFLAAREAERRERLRHGGAVAGMRRKPVYTMDTVQRCTESQRLRA